MIRTSSPWPLWVPLYDEPKNAPKPLEEDILAEKYRAANEATIAEIEALDG